MSMGLLEPYPRNLCGSLCCDLRLWSAYEVTEVRYLRRDPRRRAVTSESTHTPLPFSAARVFRVSRLNGAAATVLSAFAILCCTACDRPSALTFAGPGEGPGEFQAPGQLAMASDTIAVLEMGSGGRVSYLGPQGDFLRVSGNVGHPVMSMAIHPDSGRFFPILSREHYLVRAMEKERPRRIARIPPEFVPEIEGSAGEAGMTPNLVAVTTDGTAHVLDGQYLALVSFNPGEDRVGRIALLPREMRDQKLRERSEAGNTLGGYEVLMSQTVMRLDPLADGRLFTSVRYGTSRGIRPGPRVPDGNPDRARPRRLVE